jgi:hypothetical protein
MTLYGCNEISDYWDTRDFIPIHPISMEMPRNRFQELHMRVRLAGKEAVGPYAKVSYMSSFLLAHLLILVYIRSRR